MVDTINRWVSKEYLDPLLVKEVENDKMGLESWAYLLRCCGSGSGTERVPGTSMQK